MPLQDIVLKKARANELQPLSPNPSRLGFIARLRVARGLVAYHLTSWALSHPLPLRALFAFLRHVRPIAVLGNTVIVAKGAYVREVLKRFEDFTLGEVLSPRMPWGPFLLTIDWRDQHDRERALFESMVSRDADIARIRELTRRRCEAALAHAPINHAGRKEIDIVRAVCEPVVVELAADYFGIPVIDRDQQYMVAVLRQIAGIAMVEPPEGSRRWWTARLAIDSLTRHVKETIARQAAATTPAPLGPADPTASLLVRLVTASRATGDVPRWLDDDFVRRYVTGLAATGGATIVRATTHAISELLRRPDAVARARAVVATLDEAVEAEARARRDRIASLDVRAAAVREVEAARTRLRQVVYEALRFRPMLPLLLRYVPRETILAKGTRDARSIKAGSSVIAGPLAVMFDPDEFELPAKFLGSRPLDSFVHFGFGPRTCFGKYVADTAMVEISRVLLKLPQLALGDGSSGRVAYDGPVADSLTVTFAPYIGRDYSAD